MAVKRRSGGAIWRLALLALLALLAAAGGAACGLNAGTPSPTPAATSGTVGPTQTAPLAAETATGPAAASEAASATADPPTPPGETATVTATRRPNASATAVLSGTVASPSLSGANAVSVTQLAVFGPALAVTGTVTPTSGARLDEVAWGPGPGQIAVAGAPGVRVYDRATGQLAYPITTTAWATTLAFSLEGRALAAGTVNAVVEVYDTRTAELLAVLGGPGVRVEQVRYLPAPGGGLPAGYAVVSLGANNTLHFWDVARQAYLGPLDLGPSAAHGFDLSARAPVGRQWLAAAAGSAAPVWALPDLLAALPNFNAAPPTRTLAQPAPITSLALSADGRWLAVGNTGGTVLLWDLAAAGGGPAQTLDRLAAPAERLAFSPEGALLASAHADLLIRLWAVGGGARPVAVLAGHTDRITSVAFSPDGRELASTGWEGVVRVWGIAGPGEIVD